MTKIITNERDNEIAEFRRLAAKLGMPTMPDLHISAKVTDGDGNVLEDRYEQGHSWTRNAWANFHNAMLDTSDVVVASQAGNTSYGKSLWSKRNTSGNFVNNSYQGGYKYDNTNSSYGLQIGTSNEPFTSEDFRLFGLINAGTNTGQLSYLTMTWTEPVLNTSTNTYSFTCQRVFNNNSSAAIVVREVGLTNNQGFLMSRDVLSSPINVPVGAQLTIGVVVTSGSWNALDATSFVQPALGSYTLGGIYLGPCMEIGGTQSGDANSDYGWAFPYNHTKYALICSTIAGDSVSGKQWRTTATVTAGTYNFKDGSNNMAALYALGAGSPLGVFAAAANSASLGGYADWYVPSTYEWYRIINNKALITGADALAQGNTYYWSSTSEQSTNAIFRNATDNGEGSNPQTEAYRVRLVRRANLA